MTFAAPKARKMNGDWTFSEEWKYSYIDDVWISGLERRQFSRLGPDPYTKHWRSGLQRRYSEQPLRSAAVYTHQGRTNDWTVPRTHG